MRTVKSIHAELKSFLTPISYGCKETLPENDVIVTVRNLEPLVKDMIVSRTNAEHIHAKLVQLVGDLDRLVFCYEGDWKAGQYLALFVDDFKD